MPMDKLPAIIPPSAASLDATKEARVPAMLRIKGGQIIGIEDHLGNVLGQPLTVKSGLDGGIVIRDGMTPQANGRPLVRPNSGFVGVGDVCTVSLSAATAATRMSTRRIDVPFGAVKASILNANTAAFTGCKAIAAVTDGAADPYGSTATWKPLLFSGADSFTLPAGSGAIPAHRFGTIESDTLFLEGDVGQLLMGRVYINGANNPRFEHPTKSPTLPADGLLHSYFLGDGVTTPANYVPTYHNTGPALHWQVFPKTQCISVLVCGNSTAAGQGDSETLGWMRRAEKLAELAGYAVAVKNMSHPGSTTTDSFARGAVEIAKLKPTFTFFSVATTNGSPVLADLPRLKSELLAIIDVIRQAGSIPVGITFQPSAASGETLQVILALNALSRQIARSGAMALLDAHLLFAGSDTATTWLDPADTVDFTHPSNQGSAKLAVQVVKLFIGG